MQQEDDLRGLEKVMQLMRGISVLFLLLHFYWFCYGWFDMHGCTLGDNVLVGMGAVVMNGAVIGANSLVAAGALVTEGTQVPEGSLVVGVPAKVRRQLTLEEIEGNREAARGYAAIGRDLAEQGILYWGADIPADARTIALAQD